MREGVLFCGVRRERRAMAGTLHELAAYIKPAGAFHRVVGELCNRRTGPSEYYRLVSRRAQQRRNGVTHDRPHQIKGKVISATIERRVDLTREHFKIWLRCAESFPFEPGQYCTVGVDGVERPYSIVSSPREPLLELFVELIPPPLGHLTPLLHALRVGDTVTLRPRAKGVFLLRPEFRNHVMVATVTGVCPADHEASCTSRRTSARAGVAKASAQAMPSEMVGKARTFRAAPAKRRECAGKSASTP